MTTLKSTTISARSLHAPASSAPQLDNLEASLRPARAGHDHLHPGFRFYQGADALKMVKAALGKLTALRPGVRRRPNAPGIDGVKNHPGHPPSSIPISIALFARRTATTFTPESARQKIGISEGLSSSANPFRPRHHPPTRQENAGRPPADPANRRSSRQGNQNRSHAEAQSPRRKKMQFVSFPLSAPAPLREIFPPTFTQKLFLTRSLNADRNSETAWLV